MGLRTWLLLILASHAMSTFAIINITEFANMLYDPRWPKGIVFDELCEQKYSTQLLKLIPIMQEWLEDGRTAIDEDSKLFEFFFKRGNKTLVRRAFSKLIKIMKGEENISVMIECQTNQKECNVPGGTTVAFFSEFTDWERRDRRIPRNNLITLCPIFFSIPEVDIDPCSPLAMETNLPGYPFPTRHYVLLHEFFHIPYLVGSNYGSLQDLVRGPYEAHALIDPLGFGVVIPQALKKVFVPIWSTENYLSLTKWAWIQKQQLKHCRRYYPLFDVLNFRWPANRNELRKLLQDNTTTDIVSSDVVNVTASSANAVDGKATFQALNTSNETFHEAFDMNFSAIDVVPSQNKNPITVTWYATSPLTTSSMTSTTTTPFTTPSPAHQCYGTCTSVNRGCAWAHQGYCRCTALRINLFFWASGACVHVRKPPSINPRDLSDNNSSSSILPPPAMSIYQEGRYFYNGSTGAKVACPCNSTCVSYGCCASDDGIIWGPADTCMGHLEGPVLDAQLD